MSGTMTKLTGRILDLPSIEYKDKEIFNRVSKKMEKVANWRKNSLQNMMFFSTNSPGRTRASLKKPREQN